MRLGTPPLEETPTKRGNMKPPHTELGKRGKPVDRRCLSLLINTLVVQQN